jgi:hypothetical protein
LRILLIRGVVLFAVLAAGTACASSGTAPATSSASARNPNLISQQEIAASTASNAYELVERLRPQWLRPGAVGSIKADPGEVRAGGPSAVQSTIMQSTLVYLDNVKLGSRETLRSVSASGITSIRFLNAERATATLPDVGRDPISGAIVISTR